MAFKITTLCFFLLSVQLCLVQNVFGQCIRPNPSPCLGAGLASSGLGAGLTSSGLYGLGGLATSGAGLGAGLLGSNLGYDISSGAYGGSGVGNVNVFGELPVGGTTLLSGQVPVLGSVSFGGAVPAAGSVSISGSCGCGCNYVY